MSYSLLAFGSLGMLLLLALAWLSLSREHRQLEVDSGLPQQQREWRHISYLPQIKQSLAEADFKFLEARCSQKLARRVRTERRVIALTYLSALRADFEKLLYFARIIAVMSPQVAVAQELQGVRLNIVFFCRYRLIYFRLLCGIAPSEAVSNLSDTVSALTLRMETAMSELGERTALASELVSSYNDRGWGAG